MKRLAVDASVAVKWFLPEPHAAAALNAKNAELLFAPDLVFAEVGNVLWKHARRKALTEKTAREILRLLLAGPLEIIPSAMLAEEALRIACRWGTTVYDSIYLAAALRGRAPLVTADRKLFERTRGAEEFADTVIWVEDL